MLWVLARVYLQASCLLVSRWDCSYVKTKNIPLYEWQKISSGYFLSDSSELLKKKKKTLSSDRFALSASLQTFELTELHI